MTTCKIGWCVALAQESSDVCAAHAKDPKLHPAELTQEDLERLDGYALTSDGRCVSNALYAGACKDCKGSGDCMECDGDGTFPRECSNWKLQPYARLRLRATATASA